MHFSRRVFLSFVLVVVQLLAAHAGTNEERPVVIVVEYEALAGKENELLRILRDHARLTLEEEPGCLRFEVLKPVDEAGSPIPGRILLTEQYENDSALALHAANPRLDGLLARIRPLLKTEKVTRTRVLTPLHPH